MTKYFLIFWSILYHGIKYKDAVNLLSLESSYIYNLLWEKREKIIYSHRISTKKVSYAASFLLFLCCFRIYFRKVANKFNKDNERMLRVKN